MFNSDFFLGVAVPAAAHKIFKTKIFSINISLNISMLISSNHFSLPVCFFFCAFALVFLILYDPI